MKRGICPAGHLDQVGNVDERCKHICNDCGTPCNKRLKPWSNGYISQPCSCIELPKSDDQQIELLCPSGHATRHRRIPISQCHYTCNRCGRACGRKLQPVSEVYTEIWCECCPDDKKPYHTVKQPDYDETHGNPLDDKFCENLFDNIPFDEPAPNMTMYDYDINRAYWRLF